MKIILLAFAALLLQGCACLSHRDELPATRTTYQVGAEPDLQLDGVETVDFKGDWVILDGRRMIPRGKINYIRADRDKPSGAK